MTWELAMIGVAEAARAHRDAEAAESAFYAQDIGGPQTAIAKVDEALEALEQAQQMLERQEAVLRTDRTELVGGPKRSARE